MLQMGLTWIFSHDEEEDDHEVMPMLEILWFENEHLAKKLTLTPCSLAHLKYVPNPIAVLRTIWFTVDFQERKEKRYNKQSHQIIAVHSFLAKQFCIRVTQPLVFPTNISDSAFEAFYKIIRLLLLLVDRLG